MNRAPLARHPRPPAAIPQPRGRQRLQTSHTVGRGSLNLEMAVVPSIIDIALEVKPDMCTLVPEKREERTTEGGLDVRGRATEIGKAVRKLHDAGIGVSLFIGLSRTVSCLTGDGDTVHRHPRVNQVFAQPVQYRSRDRQSY